MNNFRGSHKASWGRKISLLTGFLLLGVGSATTELAVKPAVAQQSCSLPNAQIEQGEVNGEEVNVSVSRWGMGSCHVFYTDPSPIQVQVIFPACPGGSSAACGDVYVTINGEEAEYLGRYEGYRSGYRVRDRWGTEYQFITYDPSAANAPSNSISRDISGENVILNQSGSLSSSDEQRDDGQRLDIYSVELDRNQLIQIDVTSNDFDTVLLFANSDGDVIASNDDISQNNLNSRLSHRASSSGRYLIGVSSFQSSDRGLYQLRVTSLSN
jgi:Bacterial pre-peptidase C-terminal domain